MGELEVPTKYSNAVYVKSGTGYYQASQFYFKTVTKYSSLTAKIVTNCTSKLEYKLMSYDDNWGNESVISMGAVNNGQEIVLDGIEFLSTKNFKISVTAKGFDKGGSEADLYLADIQFGN